MYIVQPTTTVGSIYKPVVRCCAFRPRDETLSWSCRCTPTFCCSSRLLCVPGVFLPTAGTWSVSRRPRRRSSACRPTVWTAAVRHYCPCYRLTCLLLVITGRALATVRVHRPYNLCSRAVPTYKRPVLALKAHGHGPYSPVRPVFTCLCIRPVLMPTARDDGPYSHVDCGPYAVLRPVCKARIHVYCPSQPVALTLKYVFTARARVLGHVRVPVHGVNRCRLASGAALTMRRRAPVWPRCEEGPCRGRDRSASNAVSSPSSPSAACWTPSTGTWTDDLDWRYVFITRSSPVSGLAGEGEPVSFPQFPAWNSRFNTARWCHRIVITPIQVIKSFPLHFRKRKYLGCVY